MNGRGGAQKGRPSRTGATTEKTQPGPSIQPASTTASSSDDFVIIQAIRHNRTNARLDTVQRLLTHVVSNAAAVQRGTDSQRRFTSTYTEFCTSALRCMADIEEAVFEFTHPGRRAADAAESEVDGIAEDVFLRQVAAYVSTHTKSLGLAYLEHVALGALEKQQQQRKRERTATSNSSSTSGGAGQRGSKMSRTGGMLGTSAGRGPATGLAANAPNAGSAFDTLGLIDAQDTMREAMHIIEQATNATATTAAGGGDGKRRGQPQQQQQPATAALGKTIHAGRTPGLFVSKGSTMAPGNSGSTTTLLGDQAVYNLSDPQLKLTSIPELATRLQPWTMPLLSSGVYLERVTMERERKGAGGPPTTTTTGSSSSNTQHHNHHHNLPAPHHAEASKTLLDVCLSATPMELLRQYEAREAVLAAEPQPWLPASQATSAGAFSVVPYAGKRSVAAAAAAAGAAAGSGGSPRSTTAPLPVPAPPSASANAAGTTPGEADALDGASMDVDVLTSSAFFPAVRENKSMTCLPQFLISNVSHFGVSKMEFVYTMSPTPK